MGYVSSNNICEQYFFLLSSLPFDVYFGGFLLSSLVPAKEGGGVQDRTGQDKLIWRGTTSKALQTHSVISFLKTKPINIVEVKRHIKALQFAKLKHKDFWSVKLPINHFVWGAAGLYLYTRDRPPGLPILQWGQRPLVFSRQTKEQTDILICLSFFFSFYPDISCFLYAQLPWIFIVN